MLQHRCRDAADLELSEPSSFIYVNEHELQDSSITIPLCCVARQILPIKPAKPDRAVQCSMIRSPECLNVPNEAQKVSHTSS
jgi:hypothetical protein